MKESHMREGANLLNLHNIANLICNIMDRIAKHKRNRNYVKQISLFKLLIKYQSDFNMKNLKIILSQKELSLTHKMMVHNNTHKQIQTKYHSRRTTVN